MLRGCSQPLTHLCCLFVLATKRGPSKPDLIGCLAYGFSFHHTRPSSRTPFRMNPTSTAADPPPSPPTVPSLPFLLLRQQRAPRHGRPRRRSGRGWARAAATGIAITCSRSIRAASSLPPEARKKRRKPQSRPIALALLGQGVRVKG